MVEIKGVAHFSIPVSDVDASTKFYTEIVGCKFLSARPDKKITFLDAGGVCVLLIKKPAPINKAPLEGSDGVHHAFMMEHASQYQSAVDALRKGMRNLLRGRPTRRSDRRTPGLFSRSGRQRSGVHKPHGVAGSLGGGSRTLSAKPDCRWIPAARGSAARAACFASPRKTSSPRHKSLRQSLVGQLVPGRQWERGR